MRRTRSKRHRNKFDRFGYLILAGCALIVIAFGYLYFKFKPVEMDEKTLCPKTGETGIVAILIDKTEPFSPLQQEEIKVRLSDLKNNLPKAHKISIYSVGTNIMPVREIELCNPGDGKGNSELISNPNLLKKKWTEGFSKQIEMVINKDVIAENLKESPIIESIRHISNNEFLGANKANIEKKLIVVSDMMQNTTDFSQYSKPSSNSATPSKAEKNLSNLEGVQVEILYISRPALSQVQNTNHITFWQKYISLSGGVLSSVKKIVY